MEYVLCFFLSETAVIMTPTRELALQITKECKKFSKPLGLRVVCVYGGTGISEQVKTLPLMLPEPFISRGFVSPYSDLVVRECIHYILHAVLMIFVIMLLFII